MHWVENLPWQKNLWNSLYVMLSSTSCDSAWITWYSWIFIPLTGFVSVGIGRFWRRSVCPLWPKSLHIKSLCCFCSSSVNRAKILQHFTSCWNLWLKVVGMYHMQVWNVRDIINHILSVFVDMVDALFQSLFSLTWWFVTWMCRIFEILATVETWVPFTDLCSTYGIIVKGFSKLFVSPRTWFLNVKTKLGAKFLFLNVFNFTGLKLLWNAFNTNTVNCQLLRSVAFCCSSGLDGNLQSLDPVALSWDSCLISI